MIDQILERLHKARLKAVYDHDSKEVDAILREMKYLERLKKPTHAMVHASCKVAYGPGYSPDRVCEQDIVVAESELAAMLKAAEEGL